MNCFTYSDGKVSEGINPQDYSSLTSQTKLLSNASVRILIGSDWDTSALKMCAESPRSILFLIGFVEIVPELSESTGVFGNSCALVSMPLESLDISSPTVVVTYEGDNALIILRPASVVRTSDGKEIYTEQHRGRAKLKVRATCATEDVGDQDVVILEC